jgi:2-oxoglutarate dehydrogenase E1 component
LRANYCGQCRPRIYAYLRCRGAPVPAGTNGGANAEIEFTPEGKKAILSKVIDAEQYEKFLGRKYVGTKRFGLDGGESMIPALEADHQIWRCSCGVREIVYGMPHRGRLNVLANVMAKPYRIIFHEFSGGSANPEDVGGSGDVKYHLGTSAPTASLTASRCTCRLVPNPSHLEAVNPVVLGKVARQPGDPGRSRQA